MKKNIIIMVLAVFLVLGTGHFAFARHVGPGHGVRHGFYKAKKFKHHHRFPRYARDHRQPVVVVQERYIPYPEPPSYGGTELDFGSVILRLPEVVVFE